MVVQDLHYPFSAEVVDGIRAGATEHGLQVLITTGLREPDIERAAIETFLELRMDGIILISPGMPDGRLLDVAGVVLMVPVRRPLDGADSGARRAPEQPPRRPEENLVHDVDDVDGGA